MSEVSGGGVVAIDHVGYVVTNVDEAARFFVNVLGFEDMDRRGLLADTESDSMTRLFGVHPRSEGRYVFLHKGSVRVELLEWNAPDRATNSPRNSDPGGRHLALTVQDIESFLERLADEPGFNVRDRNERGFCYVGTPFGLEIQLIPV